MDYPMFEVKSYDDKHFSVEIACKTDTGSINHKFLVGKNLSVYLVVFELAEALVGCGDKARVARDNIQGFIRHGIARLSNKKFAEGKFELNYEERALVPYKKSAFRR